MATAVNIAVVALTAGGASLAERISRQLGVRVYLPVRLKEITSMSAFYFDNFDLCVEQIFKSHRQLIFIMATGIVVRKLAALLVNKRKDPAVVVMDERANFAISLLSGHYGGANKLANQMAQLTGATPVITTATDVCQRGAVDLLAQKLQCHISPVAKIKVFNRLLVENENINLYSQWLLPVNLNLKGLTQQAWSKNLAIIPPAVIITNRLVPTGRDIIKLRPRNLVVGIGCRRGVTAGEVMAAVKQVFTQRKLSLLSLKKIATVDLKHDEEGLLRAAAYLKTPLAFVTRDQIASIADQYSHSRIVKKKIGVGAVCEPTAIIASHQGQLIVPKQILGRITVAVAEQVSW